MHVVYATSQPHEATSALQALRPAWSHRVVPAAPPAVLSRTLRRSWPAQVLLANVWSARRAGNALAADSRRLGMQIVETHSYNAPALFFLQRQRRPRVLTRVSTTAGQMAQIATVHSRVFRLHTALERRVTRASDALVTHTLRHRDAVCELEGHDPRRFFIVPHGLPDPGATPADVRKDDAVEFLFVGRFEARKGIDVLLAAIPRVAAACPHARFSFVGAHGDSDLWSAFVARHSTLARDRVRAFGRVTPAELRRHYQRCDVLVAPSRYESFGLIYVEAMGHGKPVIGCAAGGVPEVVTQDVTGLLAEPGDVESLAGCMSRLARDGALRERMGRAARGDFLARFGADVMARRSAELYQTLTAWGG